MNRKSRPDRRGMGAQSDFIAQQFVPSELYKAQQLAIVTRLMQAGTQTESLQAMFLIPFKLISSETP